MAVEARDDGALQAGAAHAISAAHTPKAPTVQLLSASPRRQALIVIELRTALPRKLGTQAIERIQIARAILVRISRAAVAAPIKTATIRALTGAEPMADLSSGVSPKNSSTYTGN